MYTYRGQCTLRVFTWICFSFLQNAFITFIKKIIPAAVTLWAVMPDLPLQKEKEIVVKGVQDSCRSDLGPQYNNVQFY